jgi:uncharacterized protein
LSVYLDTSLLVSALTPEPNNAAAQAWLATQSALHISDWTVTEFHSAVALKVRTGSLQPAERQLALASLARMIDRNFTTHHLTTSDFRDAALLIDQSTNLRAGDALHLALFQRLGLSLATLDVRLARAATKLGTVTVQP